MYLLSHSFFQLISQSVTKPVRLKFLCFEWFVDPSLCMIYFPLDLWKLFGALNLCVYSSLVVLWFVMVPFCLAVFLWVFFVIFSMCETRYQKIVLCCESGTVCRESWQILLPPEVTPRNKDPSGVKTTVSFFTRPCVTRCSTEWTLNIVEPWTAVSGGGQCWCTKLGDQRFGIMNKLFKPYG